jgi:hypothetical protein
MMIIRKAGHTACGSRSAQNDDDHCLHPLVGTSGVERYETQCESTWNYSNKAECRDMIANEVHDILFPRPDKFRIERFLHDKQLSDRELLTCILEFFIGSLKSLATRNA